MSKFEERYKILNKEQKQAVDSIEGPVLVVAGPGSGKTEILGLRVANILRKTDVLPGNILCLTFTDSASVNMRERLKELMGPAAYKVAIHTFHGFGREIRNYHPEIFYESDIFTAADNVTQDSILEEIFEDLPHDNPISSYHPSRGYVFLNDTKKAIKDLKEAGITTEEFSEILDHNEDAIEFLDPLIQEVFGTRISKSLFETLPEILVRMKDYDSSDFPVGHMEPLVPVVVESLQRVLNKAKSKNTTKPLTKWKKNWTRKTKDGEQIIKASKYKKKMRALSDVYTRYTKEMYKRGYYDFKDMILDVIEAIQENDDLRYELQEQFQYILVDEFQDTNDAQMRLLNLLTDSPVHEGRPNIMAVGDDDQAVYKFQGAEISNIIKFKDKFRNPEVITLTHNYRSRQEILDTARYIITQGDERLENTIDDVDKDLKSSNKDIEDGNIVSKSFPDKSHEYHWVAEEINKKIEDGVEPEEIAVITRKHKNLKEIIPHLAHFDIPISYEQQRDVLEEFHILQLIQMSRFVVSLMDPDQKPSDDLLPEILSYPFWDFDRDTLWTISRQAYENRTLWLECMKQSDDKYVRDIANFFLDLAASAQHEPLEQVLDTMIGTHTHSLSDSEDEDNNQGFDDTDDFVSPFKRYYFGMDKFTKNPASYLTFLSGLRTFIYALREYKSGETIDLKDLIKFVDTHKDNNISLPDKSTFVSSKNAVQILTAHGAKGQEFDTVFVLNCLDDVWAGRSRGTKLPFSQNLPISPAGDTRDDQLRLFYVATTRAQRNMYLTSYEYDGAGKEKNRLEFIAQPKESHDFDSDIDEILDTGDTHTVDDPDVEQRIIESSWESYHHPPFKGDESVLIEKVLENYKLNVTHFNNFLNVYNKGPQKLLEDNLLKFPQPKTASLSFGTAVHSTLNQVYKHLKKKEDMPDKSQVMDWFEKFLYNQRLSEKDFKKYLNKGIDVLGIFYEKKSGEFHQSDLSEFNFKSEGVVVEDVPLTGKIDKLSFSEDDKSLVVYDFKTGSSLKEWGKGSKYQKVKSWQNKNQIIFYKLLVENSRKFGEDYSVNKGVIEFVEPDDDEIIDLEYKIKEEDVERLTSLIEVIYDKIMNLEFPDIDKYDESIKGVKNFEDDLLEGNI